MNFQKSEEADLKALLGIKMVTREITPLNKSMFRKPVVPRHSPPTLSPIGSKPSLNSKNQVNSVQKSLDLRPQKLSLVKPRVQFKPSNRKSEPDSSLTIGTSEVAKVYGNQDFSMDLTS